MFFSLRSICNSCALDLGGSWPDGHIATCNEAICPYCLTHTDVCDISDWNWAKDSDICQSNTKKELTYGI